MTINFELFEQWVNDRFQGDYVVSGKEIRINSIFVEDYKHKLWCNPSGGKHHREDGCYRCFKTDKNGTLAGLVMLVDQCTYGEAKDILNGQLSVADLEDKLHAFFENKEKEIVKPIINKINLPDNSLLISSMSEESIYRMNAENYLFNRKLPSDGLYYCAIGDYEKRIIIPYYDHEGSLVYFNGRHVDSKAKLRYMGPPKTIGVGKGDVLYSPMWAKDNSKIHLTEGEFDALTLQTCGFNGVACGGKFLTDVQLNIIKKHNYKVCLSLDTDLTVMESASPGFVATIEMARKFLSSFIPVTFTRPPVGIKDWNAMLVAFKPEIVKEYINKSEKVLDPLYLEQLLCLV